FDYESRAYYDYESRESSAVLTIRHYELSRKSCEAKRLTRSRRQSSSGLAINCRASVSDSFNVEAVAWLPFSARIARTKTNRPPVSTLKDTPGLSEDRCLSLCLSALTSDKLRLCCSVFVSFVCEKPAIRFGSCAMTSAGKEGEWTM